MSRPSSVVVERVDYWLTDSIAFVAVSMMSDGFMNLLSDVGKLVRESSEPFGGIQVIFAGDFFQLPPVVTDNSDQAGDKSFAFNSRTWKEALPAERCHFLHHAHRQKDPKFAAMLDRLRFGGRSSRDCKTLATKSKTIDKKVALQVTDPSSAPTFLSAINKDVEAYNNACIAALPGKDMSHTFSAVDSTIGATERVANSSRLRGNFVTDAKKDMIK